MMMIVGTTMTVGSTLAQGSAANKQAKFAAKQAQAQADAIPAAINNIIARQALIITAVNQLIGGAPVTSDLKTQFNALIEEMQKRDAIEQG